MENSWLITVKYDGATGANDLYRLQPYIPDERLCKREADLGYTFLAYVDGLITATCIISGMIAIATERFKNTPEHIDFFHKQTTLVNKADYE